MLKSKWTNGVMVAKNQYFTVKKFKAYWVCMIINTFKEGKQNEMSSNTS